MVYKGLHILRVTSVYVLVNQLITWFTGEYKVYTFLHN